LQQVRENPADVLAGVKRSASYAKGLWVRLNGGGRSGNRQEPLPAELPVPVSTKVLCAAKTLTQVVDSTHPDCSMTSGAMSSFDRVLVCCCVGDESLAQACVT
jgi:hypothetical protein